MPIPDGAAGCPRLFTWIASTTVRVQSENNGASGNTTCHHCSQLTSTWDFHGDVCSVVLIQNILY